MLGPQINPETKPLSGLAPSQTTRAEKLAGVVPESVQQDIAAMRANPQAWAKNVKAPGAGDIPGILSSVAGSMPLATAYHGSPHTFEKFSMEKIGTGQGAQSYGHGLYFAENPATAEAYAKDLARMTVGGKEMNVAEAGHVFGGTAEGTMLSGSQIYHMADDIVKAKLAGAKAVNKTYPAGSPEANLFDKMNKEISVASNKYTVTIPDEHINKMLDWDKPLSEQPEILQRTKQLGITKEDIWNSAMPAFKENPPANFNPSGENLYKHLARTQPGRGQTAQLASEQLSRLGIPGIKYLDQGSRGREIWQVKHPQGGVNEFSSQAAAQDFLRRGNEGKIIPPNVTRNFVVFDPEIIKNLERQ